MTPEENYSLPAGEELKEQQGEFSPLCADDYIVKVAKIELEKKPTRNAASKKFNYNDLELQYTLVCLPYKLKAEDGLKFTNWKDAKPLQQRIWRGFSPFSMWVMKNWDPSFLRGFIAYAQGWASADANTKITYPGIIVLTKNDDIATEEETKLYKTQFKQFLADKNLDTFTAKKDWFKHIPDIRSLEWNYVWARVIVDDKGRNKIWGFSKLPWTFKADATLELEAMAKFSESYKKVINKRQEKEGWPSTPDAVISTDDLPF